MIRTRNFLFFFIGILLSACNLNVSGQTAVVEGVIKKGNGEPVQWVNIVWVGNKTGATTDSHGYYRLKLPAGKPIHLSVSFIGYQQRDTSLFLRAGEKRQINFKLKAISTNLPGFEIRDESLRTENIIRLNPRDVLVTPATSSGVEGLIKTLPGVSSSNELSSEYSVRGGNFDDVRLHKAFG